MPACTRNRVPTPAAKIHRAGVFMASFRVQAGSSAGWEACSPGASPSPGSTGSGSGSPSGRSPISSGCWTIRKVTGTRAIIHTRAPSTIHAMGQPWLAMTAEAIRGKATSPMEWEANSMPLVRPRIRTNQRDTTTEAPMGMGLAKITRLIP